MVMRLSLLISLPLWTGCGSTLECGPGTHEEDGVCVPGEADTDTDETDTDVGDGSHPMAPEKYKWLWNVEGSCETYGSRQGNQVYILAEDVQVDESGMLSGQERWYWFQAGEGWEGDCVDTFQITGSPFGVDKAQYQCSQCEEVYEVSRVLTEANCELNYNYFLIGYDWSDGFPDSTRLESYSALLLMDTLNPNGEANEDNKMLLLQAKADQDGQISPAHLDNDFATGHAIPNEAGQPVPPGTYDWLAEKCIRTSF
jgi:hypothetical protein